MDLEEYGTSMIHDGWWLRPEYQDSGQGSTSRK